MAGEDYINIGKILKTFGNHGDLIVKLEFDNLSGLQKMESVFLELDGERVPFFIESIEPKADHRALIRFEAVNSVEKAARLTGAELFISISRLPALPEDEFYFHEILGFKVQDEEYGPIGLLKEVLEMPHQDILRIMNKEKEILIPAVDKIIMGIDRRKRIIHIKAPEGLIALYLK
jgi:16S rRNA processing protein RimM